MPLTEDQELELDAQRSNGQQPDMSRMDLRGVDLSQDDLTGIRLSADALSYASGLETVQGVDPHLLAEAKALQPHVQRLDALQNRLDTLREETGIRKNLFNNLRHLAHGGVEGEKNLLQGEIAKEERALQQTRDGFARQPLPGNQNGFEPKTTYAIGAELTRQAPAVNQAMQGTQASDTFRVTSTVPLDDRGATTAFGKSLMGTKIGRMEEAGVDAQTLRTAKFQEANNINNVAALFGTHEAVDSVPDPTDVHGKMAALNVDPTSLLSRSVATSAVDKALGMNCMAEEKFGIDPQGNPVGISVGVPGAPILKSPETTEGQQTFLQVDYANADIQKGLFDLEAQDYITCQSDRHTGNIFIDPHTNAVSGIDNDLAFPVVSRDDTMRANRQVTAKVVRDMPMYMHADTADKIEAMTPQALRQALESTETPDGVAPLEPEAIDGAVQRLGELQNHIKDLRQQGRVVPEFNRDTYNEAFRSQLAQADEEEGVKVFTQFSHNLVRTSYLGSAIIEQEKTKVINLGGNEQGHRLISQKDDVDRAAPVPPQFTAYRQAVAAAKQDILANPRQLQDAKLADTIATKSRDVTDFERKLAADTEFMTTTQNSLKTAIENGNELEIADLRDTLGTVQEMRQDTLQHLATAKNDLNRALDRAVDGQKPQIAQAVNDGRLHANQAPAQGWQRNAQPRQQPDAARNLNIGQRPPVVPVVNAPVPANASQERPQLIRPAGPPPPVPDQVGLVPSMASQNNSPDPKSTIETKARPELKRPDRPPPPLPVDSNKAEEPEVKMEEAEEVDDLDYEHHKVKETLKTEDHSEKRDHSRKNSVGADIKWARAAPSKGEGPSLGRK